MTAARPRYDRRTLLGQFNTLEQVSDAVRALGEVARPNRLRQ